MEQPPSFIYINATNMLMPITVITRQFLIQFITNIITIFAMNVSATTISILVLAIVTSFVYNKCIEMEETMQYLLQMDHMRQSEWEKMMKHQSKICTKLKKEFEEKIFAHKEELEEKLFMTEINKKIKKL